MYVRTVLFINFILFFRFLFSLVTIVLMRSYILRIGLCVNGMSEFNLIIFKEILMKTWLVRSDVTGGEGGFRG